MSRFFRALLPARVLVTELSEVLEPLSFGARLQYCLIAPNLVVSEKLV